jgi:hypothetical protein
MSASAVPPPEPLPTSLDGWVSSEVWAALLTLSNMAVPQARWTVVGGTMVNLHLAERQREPRRTTEDADVVVDVRFNPGALPKIAQHLDEQGCLPQFGADVTGGTVAHRFGRDDGATIDLLAPEGVNNPERLRTTGAGKTIEATGGQMRTSIRRSAAPGEEAVARRAGR